MYAGVWYGREAEDMRVLFIANHDPRKRYRFLLEPLREVGVAADLFDGSGAMPMVLFRAMSALRAVPRAEVIILTGGDIRNFAWFLLARLITRSKIVLRFGGDPLEVRNSVERGFRARRNWLNFLRSYIGKTFTKIMLRRVDAVVVVSGYLLGNMRSALGEKVRTLVLPPTLKPPQAQAGVADKLPAGDDTVNLLTVTNLNYREKADGVMIIAGAIDRLPGRQGFDSPIRYDVVGGGYQLDFMRRSIGDSSVIRLHGRSDNVSEFYRRADIFVYCSTLDGYPLVLCEAQSYGLPIVANRWGAFPDMLSENEDALFFDGDDGDQLAGLLARLIEDESLRRRMNQAAVTNFVIRHSSIDCGKRLQQFLRSLI